MHVNWMRSFSFLGCGFAHFFGQIVSVIVKTIGKINLVASRHIKKRKSPHYQWTRVAQQHLCLSFLIPELHARKHPLHLLTLLLVLYCITVEPGLISVKLRGHSWDTVKWLLHGG